MSETTASAAAARRQREREERADVRSRRGPRPVLTAHEIETMICDLSDEMENDSYAFADLCDNVHEAEMDYKHAFHTKVVTLASGPKMTADVRKSTAWLATEELERIFGMMLAAKEAAISSRYVKQSRLDGLRTLSASVRAMT